MRFLMSYRENVRRAIYYVIIRRAERDGMLPSGLADSIVKPRSDSKPRKALTGSQVDSPLSSLDMRLSMHGIIMVAVTCGLRRSEIAALNVDDVDGRCITFPQPRKDAIAGRAESKALNHNAKKAPSRSQGRVVSCSLGFTRF